MIFLSLSGSAKSARSSRARRRRVAPAARSRIRGARRAPSAGSRSGLVLIAGGPGNSLYTLTILVTHVIHTDSEGLVDVACGDGGGTTTGAPPHLVGG